MPEKELPPDFVGIIKDGEVLIDDTAYVRIQRAEQAARERFENRAANERAELALLVGQAANDRHSDDERMAFRLDLQSAIRAFENVVVAHICELEREHVRGK